MEYKYRESYTGNFYRKAPGQLAEAYDFETGEWRVTPAARDAFYEGDGTFMIKPEELLIEIGKVRERYGF